MLSYELNDILYTTYIYNTEHVEWVNDYDCICVQPSLGFESEFIFFKFNVHICNI